MWLKITALIIALVIWINAVMNREVQINYQVPVRIMNVPDSMIIAGMSQRDINIQLNGKTSEFLSMKLLNMNIFVYIDLNDYDVKANVPIDISLNNEFFVFPRDPMSIEKIRERDISIIVDSVETKYVPIMPVIENTPAEGYMKYGEIVYSPEKVKITGGRNLISGIYHIETEPVDINSATKTFSVKKKINEKYSFVTVEPRTVTISIPVDKIERKSFEHVPVEFINSPSNRTMNPDSFLLDVVIEGPKSIIGNIFSGELAPLIDLSSYRRPGHYKIPVSISYENIHVISLNPESLEFNIK